jgi:lysophospholipase L1-like esterase
MENIMRRSSPVFVAVLLALLAQPQFTLADVAVPPGDPHIQYVGRFTEDFRFGWTGSTLRIKFEGTSAAALLTPTRTAAMQVVVDGKPTGKLILKHDQARYVLAADLPAGPHTIELFQRTEGYFGEVKFSGFELSDNATLLDLPKVDRRILVFGDSITCAYASEEPDRSKGNSVANENGYMSYAAVAARAVHADVSMVCWSGRGIFRNRNTKGDDRATVIPTYLERTLPLSKAAFDLTTYVPQVIVINLGTNDLNIGKDEKPKLEKGDYLGAYRRFIDKLHKAYPKAQIIAAIGPMALKPLSDWLPDLEEDYPFVHAFTFSKYRGDSEIGGHWHPSVAGQQRMGNELAATIKTLMKW